jgi:hypothetical protein
MASDPRISDGFVGLSCTDVERFGTESWRFEFGEKTTLDVRCPWRIIADGKIALGYADHAQQFGLPMPLDGVSEAKQLLSSSVAAVIVEERTADLIVDFEGGTSLEIFNSSSGYEGWECASDTGLLAIGVGGGELQVFITDPPAR